MKVYLVETYAAENEKVFSLLSGAAFLSYVKSMVNDGYFEIGEKPKNTDEAVTVYNANETTPVNVVNMGGEVDYEGSIVPGASAEITVCGDKILSTFINTL